MSVNFIPPLLTAESLAKFQPVGHNLEQPGAQLKPYIWLYFVLLIFEGGLRKWVLPGLATPLLIIRDPVALILILMALKRGLLPTTIYLGGMVVVGILAVNTALVFGHGNVAVALYGARILLLHFPLIFIIGHVFDKDDVLKMGKVLLWMSVPMVVLIALQFYSPQSAWVNRGLGGSVEGAGFSGALGFLRPPGTFSFTNGLSLFFGLVASFLLYFWLNPAGVNKILLVAATAGLLAAIPLSISRTLLFMVIVAVIFAVLVMLRKPGYLGKILGAAVIVMVALMFLGNTSFFKTATEALTNRYETASDHEGGVHGTLINRWLGGMLEPIFDSHSQPFFGHGIGMGTNVGAMLLTGDNTVFLISEGEWGRLIGELGPLLGLAVILLRLALSFRIVVLSYRKLLANDLLPWFLLSFALLTIPQAQWAQPTVLGFGTLVGGLIIASLRPSNLPENS